MAKHIDLVMHEDKIDKRSSRYRIKVPKGYWDKKEKRKYTKIIISKTVKDLETLS